jgi:Fic-DOC domain mobile mystery protein B
LQHHRHTLKRWQTENCGMTDSNATSSDRSGLLLAASPAPSDEEINQAELAGIISARSWLANSRLDFRRSGFWMRLHKEIFGDVWSWAGAWRTDVKNIGVQPIQVPIHMRELEADLDYWLSAECEMEQLEVIAQFHRKSVWIHPFENGNGRWSRLATDALMIKQYAGSYLTWANPGEDLRVRKSAGRQQYIDAIQKGDRGEIAPLMAYLRHLNPDAFS